MRNWVEGVTRVLSKSEIVKRMQAMHDDLSTPWTYKRMAMEIRGHPIDRRTLENAAKKGEMSDRTQLILSRFLLDIESGRLRVFYEDPEARRYVWGTKHPETPGTPEYVQAKKDRKFKNRVSVIRKAFPVERVVKQLKITIGTGGPKLQPEMKIAHGDMPAFNDVVKLKGG